MSNGLSTQTNEPTRLAQTEYPLINPLLLCSLDGRVNVDDVSLQKQITDFIKQREASGALEDMSVYLQEYGRGKVVEINDNEQYDPASLLKVPLMIAYFQLAEKDPGILSQQTSFTGADENNAKYFKSTNNIKPGVSYTIDQLLRSMIINSDNSATALLSNYVGKDSLLTVYTDLGLPLPPNDPSVQYLSAKSYAYFFRILYNSTYLDREYSQKALGLLSEGHLPNGIASAVPIGTTVADKFGERSVFNPDGTLVERELHDCGIVYKTGSPYLLCIMSKGTNFDRMAENIHDLSSLVYESLTR